MRENPAVYRPGAGSPGTTVAGLVRFDNGKPITFYGRDGIFFADPAGESRHFSIVQDAIVTFPCFIVTILRYFLRSGEPGHMDG
jgi:hypothetical protein